MTGSPRAGSAFNDSNSVERQAGSTLSLEIGLDILLEIQPLGKRFKASVIGGEANNYIIIKPPAARDAIQLLLPGTLLTLRFLMSRGRICGFQSVVQQNTTKPHSLIFISYPAYYEVLKLRKHDRVHCYQPVTFYIQAHEYSGHILNISTGGCLISFPSSASTAGGFKEKNEIFLNFRKFESDDSGYVQGRIKKVVRHDDQTSVAVEFDELTGDVREDIEHYVGAVYDHLAA